LAEYYFDMETTGFDFDTDEIITIQWQRLGYDGEPIGEFNILKRWDYKDKENAELEMIKEFIPKLKLFHWDFIFIGKNLMFDFCLLDRRMRHYGLGKIGLKFLHDRPILDLKPVLVMLNNGRFKDFQKIIPQTNPTKNEDIPILYKQEKYPQIIQYVIDESRDFLKAYQILKREISKLRPLLSTKSPEG